MGVEVETVQEQKLSPMKKYQKSGLKKRGCRNCWNQIKKNYVAEHQNVWS